MKPVPFDPSLIPKTPDQRATLVAASRSLANSSEGRDLAQDLANSPEGRDLARAVTNSSEGRDLAQDLANSPEGRDLARAVTNSIAGRDLTRAVISSPEGRDLARAVTNNIASRDLTRAVANSIAGRDIARAMANSPEGRAFAKDLANRIAGRDIARAVANSPEGRALARAIANSMAGRALAQDLVNSPEGRDLARAIANSIVGRDLAQDLVNSPEGRDLARDLANSIAGRALAKDLANNGIAGRALARVLANSDAGRALSPSLADPKACVASLFLPAVSMVLMAGASVSALYAVVIWFTIGAATRVLDDDADPFAIEHRIKDSSDAQIASGTARIDSRGRSGERILLTFDVGPGATLAELVQLLANLDVLVGVSAAWVAVERQPGESDPANDRGAVVVPPRVGTGLDGVEIRIEHLEYRVPLELIVAGAADTVGAFAGLTQLIRLIHDWRMDTTRAETGLLKVGAEADKTRAKANEPRAETRRIDLDICAQVPRMLADSNTVMSPEILTNLINSHPGAQDAIDWLAGYEITIAELPKATSDAPGSEEPPSM
ncbi:MAG: hypothetical protein GY724_01515 [Actinomycetia bacterium]|nr:hypothetical protein [Actinomycetes bacterium]